MDKLKKKFSLVQIGALLKKDLIVRFRQPWMTIVQFLWPCLIFLALYTLRGRFQPHEMPECQFPTRVLPAKNHLLPFFHSYICTLRNECLDTEKYVEYSKFEDAPLKPVLNIIQTFLNEDPLYNAIVNLPEKMNFVSAAMAVVTHPKFSYMEENVNAIIARIPQVQKILGHNFDIKKLFADNRMFSNSGKLICGQPFPRSDNIRFVENILYTEDMKGANDDELNSMPTKYCKQLYLDVTNSNHGKMTWSQLKPIIQGKILYGPNSTENDEIIKYANTTFEELNKLRSFAGAINLALQKLRTDEEFQKSFKSLINLTKSPIVQLAIGDSFNVESIELAMNFITNDKTVADVIQTVYNILECFSVDRFIPVDSEKILEQKAQELNDKKLFYAGIYFNGTSTEDISYKLRMDVDNSPVTIENYNRFWFPGPEASFALDMRYHRGFVQIKHSLDLAIIKAKKIEKIRNEPTTPKAVTDGWETFFDGFGSDSSESPDVNETDTITNLPVDTSDDNGNATKDFNDENVGTNITESGLDSSVEKFLNFEDEGEKNSSGTETFNGERVKRSPQFGGGLLSFLFNGDANKDDNLEKFDVDDVVVHTKQFPYPSYTKDDFKTGLYLAQSVQMAFFIGLIVQVATSVRYRIWMQESKNTMLMRTMGLKSTSEITSWIITTFIELTVIFILCCFILYVGHILQHTELVLLFLFLLLFGVCLISFCYMCSTFFASASIGSVATAILFLLTFMPYIIIISLGTTLSGIGHFLSNLSLSTAFCYAWRNIMRLELQGKGLSVGGDFNEDFKYAVCMIIFDTILYIVIGYFVERRKTDEFKFHNVPQEDLDPNVGALFDNVSKVYVEKIALSNVSMTFPRDSVTCLLGRNGAGKSTIIKILTGQIQQTTGRAVLSRSLCDSTKMDQIGFCAQDNIFIPNLTAKEHMEMYARIKLDHGFQLEVARTMKSLNFGKYENYQVCNLSGGYQRRLCVAIAFLGSPNVVILDEPCSGVDTKARRCVWELIESLRKGRAVILATHYLEEAEYLSDSIIIMKEGKVVAEQNQGSMDQLIGTDLRINITLAEDRNIDLTENIKSTLNKYVENATVVDRSTNHTMDIKIPYLRSNGDPNKCADFILYLENIQTEKQISNFSISTKNLEEIFSKANEEIELTNGGGGHEDRYEKIDLSKKEHMTKDSLSYIEIIQELLRKRFLHFRRNYKLLICILILPAIFEIIAMGFMKIRPEGDHDKLLELSKSLYGESVEFLSSENVIDFSNKTIVELNTNNCPHCVSFNDSETAFWWLLNTFDDDNHMKRYGGLTFNESFSTVWYNNKGYHSMVAWLNELNSAMLKAEMKDSSLSIRSYNHPLKLGRNELSRSSILQQVADSGISLILLIAFSLVIAGASVFLVNERVSGEKLQQFLCGVKVHTYWGIAFFWDFIVYLTAILLCVIIFEIFNIPTYVAKSNLNAICLLLLLYGFATIPAVHCVEKLFSDASFANMTIFCMNVVIALSTITVIIMFDVLGETDEAEEWRNFLNRAFLIFPQHALSDGLISICKNYILSEIFSRYDIDSYQSPVTSSLLRPNYVALFLLGVFFMALNYAIESGIFWKLYKKSCQKNNANLELQIVSIQNSLKRDDKYNNYSDNYALKVENLCKKYNQKEYAVAGTTFYVKAGECFGLLGNNGAGKSTIFKILSGEINETSGTVDFFNKEKSYCPQTCALDPLLTVKEVIHFYGKLRRIINIHKLTLTTLKAFHLEAYKDILVKNLSGGNRRKLNVAVSCFGDTSIVLMDEPTSDMDPMTRSLAYQAITDLISEQRSVLLTSHTISEIDRVCDRIGVLKDGSLITIGTPDQLKETFGGYYNITIYYDKIDALSMEREITQEFSECHDIQIHPRSMKFVVKVKLKQNDKENNEIMEHDGSLFLSDIFTKLDSFCTERGVRFTITKCKLDKVFENILDANDGSYIHKGYVQTETVT